MKPIPILHLITRLIVGGAQENTMYTAQMLDKRLYRVDVVSGIQTGNEGSLIEEVISRGIALTLMPELVREINPLKDLIALLKLTRLMRKNHYALIHTHSSKAGILGRLAAKIAGVPVIVHTVHGWSFHDYMTPPLRALYIWLERLTAGFTDRMIAVTRMDVDKGLANHIANPQQYALIHSAIPLADFDPSKVDRLAMRRSLGIPADCPVVGNIGRFSAQKNPFDWIKIAALVVKEVPDCYFLMVGDGPLRKEAESLMESLGIRSRVITTGLRRDIPQLLSALDVFLLTSLWEGLPRVIPQAMLIGVPVVAYRTDGVAEAVQPGKTGFLCEPGDLSAAAELCCQLLEDAELRHRIAQQSCQFASQNFDLSTMISQIEQVYQKLLDHENIP